MSSSEFLPRGLVRQTAPPIETASDSGYGGSEGVPEAMGEILAGNGGNETNRAQWASNVQQLYYNQNRVSLGRSINRTVETLKVR
jgi:mitofusin 2